jgi:hypothetical protein
MTGPLANPDRSRKNHPLPRNLPRPHQQIRRNPQPRSHPSHHRQRQPALAVHHLRHPRPAPNHRLQILPRQPLLLHPKFNRRDRIGRIHRKVLFLIRIHQRRKHIEFVAFNASGPRSHQLLDPLDRGNMVSPRLNWLNLNTGFSHSPPSTRRSCRIPCVRRAI